MKKKAFILTVIFFVCAPLFADDFIHPLDFKGTDKEKQEVIAFIQENVKKTYTAIGMGDPLILRMMEKEELEAFKKLMKAKNRKLLDNVIETYCSIGMCNYSTIFMMYREQLEASQEKLTW